MTHTQTQGADGAGTKTAGQAAYEAAIADLRYAPQWSDMTEADHQQWDRAAAAILTKACEPWEPCFGDPPECGSPLHGVFVAGMIYTERLLASLLNLSDYEHGDGSEDFDADATQSLRNILIGASLWDADENRPVFPSPAATPDVRSLLRTARSGLATYGAGAFEGTIAQIDAILAFDPATPAPAATPGVPDSLRALSEAASQGEWSFWREPILSAEEAVRELTLQVEQTSPLASHLYLLNANGKCPATTGCGPTSQANANFIVAAVNYARTLISAQPAGQAGDAGAVKPCAWVGGNDTCYCRTCGEEYRYGREDKPPCPRTPAPNSTRTGAAESDDLSDRLRREIGEIRTMAADPENKAAFCELTVVADNLEALLPAADQEGAR